MVQRLAAAALIAWMSLGWCGPVAADGPSWGEVAAPTTGPARSIGSYAAGCLAGGRMLPLEGAGYQAVRLDRGRLFGNPELLSFIEDLARRIDAGHLGRAAVGDLAQARGGPMESLHASHQLGLDVDIFYRLDLQALPRIERGDLDLPSVVDSRTNRVDPLLWGPQQAAMLRLAATDPRVERIFVAPPVKLALCGADWSDRAWLRVVRPWFGHQAHFHVRLRCPADSPDCRPQDPPPPGDGCGAELSSWLTKPKPAPAPPVPPPPHVALPPACTAVLQWSPGEPPPALGLTAKTAEPRAGGTAP